MEHPNGSQPNKDEDEKALRHLIVLPTDHSKVLQLKDKLLSFHDRGWEVKDFGAFGAFEWGFIIIEIYDLQGYRNFKKDTCSLAEQGMEYVYPEHVACWI